MSASLPAELERTAEAMRREGLDALLLTSPPNVTYVAGYEVPLPVGFVADVTRWLPTAALVVADGSGALVSNDIDAEAARRGSWWTELHAFQSLGQLEPVDPERSFEAALTAALRAAGLSGAKATVGVEATFPRAAELVLAAECPAAELRDGTAAIEDARRIKTPRELELIGGAVALADGGQRSLLKLAATAAGDLTDLDVWGEAVAAMERLAGRTLPVSGGIVTGAATAIWTSPGPVGAPVEGGDPVLLDIGPRLDGYWADCANTVVVGAEPTREQRRYLNASRAACLAGIDALRPGRRCAEAWEAVRTALERGRIPMSHYAGHQIGTSVNERPRLLPYDETVIEAGMVFALEAGAYAGTGGTIGARAERVALVTDSDPLILSRFAWD